MLPPILIPTHQYFVEKRSEGKCRQWFTASWHPRAQPAFSRLPWFFLSFRSVALRNATWRAYNASYKLPKRKKNYSRQKANGLKQQKIFKKSLKTIGDRCGAETRGKNGFYQFPLKVFQFFMSAWLYRSWLFVPNTLDLPYGNDK